MTCIYFRFWNVLAWSNFWLWAYLGILFIQRFAWRLSRLNSFSCLSFFELLFSNVLFLTDLVAKLSQFLDLLTVALWFHNPVNELLHSSVFFNLFQDWLFVDFANVSFALQRGNIVNLEDLGHYVKHTNLHFSLFNLLAGLKLLDLFRIGRLGSFDGIDYCWNVFEMLDLQQLHQFCVD